MNCLQYLKYANLHLHSTYSDGVLTPEELCEGAAALGYGAAVLTDHETCAGYERFQKAAHTHGLETMIGMELYAKIEGIPSFHLTALDFDPKHPAMADYLARMWEGAYLDTKDRFDRLSAENKLFGLTWEELCEDFPAEEHWLCNEQVFASLLKRKGLTQAQYHGFSRMWGQARRPIEKPFVSKDPAVVIRTVRDAGGIPILAHPHDQTQYLPELYDMGLLGVEYDHPDLQSLDAYHALDFAAKHPFYLSGGTDHTGLLANAPHERLESPTSAYNLPLATDVRCGVTKEQFEAIKNRIYG